jgi:pimeloyl-ACP methyl ester carboxylesterase
MERHSVELPGPKCEVHDMPALNICSIHGRVLLATVVFAASLASIAPVAAQANDARPLVLVVHGRGQLGRDSAYVRREAYHALQRGFRAIDADVSLRESDVRLVWYADLLDSHALGAPVVACPSSARGMASTSPDNALTTLASLAGFLVESAVGMAGDSSQYELRSMAGDLRYLGDSDTRCAAESRVEDALREAALEHRPVILMSHSLGALVSWGALSHASVTQDSTIPEVTRWITMGSPLGSSEVRMLLFGQDRALERPSRVRSWANVLGHDDPFAMRVSPDSAATSTLFDVTSATASDDPHLIVTYLADPATARLVFDAWRAVDRP